MALEFPKDRISIHQHEKYQGKTNLGLGVNDHKQGKAIEVNVSNSQEGMRMFLTPEQVLSLHKFLNTWLQEYSESS